MLHTEKAIFLIKPRAGTIANSYIVQEPEQVLKALSKIKHGIDFVKQYNVAKMAFQRVSKQQVLNTFSFDTECFLKLQEQAYFK